MNAIIEKAAWLIDKLKLNYKPIGLILGDKKPDNSIHFKNNGQGCIASLIFSAAKGKTVAIDRDSTGYACSAFYLGYADWIFPGIENFLSDGPAPAGRECERFVKSPELPREFVKSYVPQKHSEKTYTFKPIVNLDEEDKPEVVIFFANADQMSALVFLIQFAHPLDFDRIKTGFASACMCMTTIPLHYANNNEEKAFWGLHDIAVRSGLPKELMTLAMPYSMFIEICEIAPDSFLITEQWEKLSERIRK